MKRLLCILTTICVCLPLLSQNGNTTRELQTAKAPLFRDPVHDGAADPVLMYNYGENSWHIFYTSRRANVAVHGTNWCYGTRIGVAVSTDNGKSWNYKGTLDLDFEPGDNTFWAPHVIYDNDTYHLFVTYIRGIHETWSGIGKIAHYTSKDLWDWKFDQLIPLSEDPLLDATVYKKANGQWGMWYKNGRIGYTVEAVSNDLKTWKNISGITIGDKPHEAPFVFFYKDYYWLLTDQWEGLGVYRSKDSDHWEKQGVILGEKGTRKEDGVRASHPCIVTTENNAYVFYFTHPGWEKEGGWGDEKGKLDEAGILPHIYRRSSIQVAAFKVENGILSCDRNAGFDFYLPDLKKGEKAY